MNDRLRFDLADLAEDVQLVDLRDRSLRTSRRLARRRALAAAVAAATVVLVSAGTIAVALRGNQDRSLPPTGPTAGPTVASPTPTVTGSTSPSDFAFPPPPASATRMGPWSTAPAAAFPGRALFFADGAGEAAITVLSDATARRSSLGYLNPQTSCIAQTLSFSPDGSHVAWVRGDLSASARGQLVSTEMATRRASAVANDVNCGTAYWTVDSRSVIAGRAAATRQISLDTGKESAARNELSDYHAAVPGFLAYPDNGDIVVEDGKGHQIHRLPYVGWPPVGFSIQGVSYDGRYVGVNFRNTDPDRVELVARVVDLTTGQEIDLPVPAGQSLVTVQFLPDLGLVMQTSTADGSRLVRVDSGGTVVAQADVPAGAGVLLRYVP